MEKEALSDQSVGQYFNKQFVCIRLDFSNDKYKDIHDRYKITGFPTLLFLNSKGQLVYKYVGWCTTEHLLSTIKRLEDKDNSWVTQDSKLRQDLSPTGKLKYAQFLYQNELNLSESQISFLRNDVILADLLSFQKIDFFIENVCLEDKSTVSILKSYKDAKTIEQKKAASSILISICELQKDELLGSDSIVLARKQHALNFVKKHLPEQNEFILRFELEILSETYNWDEYVKKMNIYIDNYGVQNIYFIRKQRNYFFYQSPKTDYLNHLESWYFKICEISNEPEYQYELAFCAKLIGHKDIALKYANMYRDYIIQTGKNRIEIDDFLNSL
jgi:hypothetical protein